MQNISTNDFGEGMMIAGMVMILSIIDTSRNCCYNHVLLYTPVTTLRDAREMK